MTSNDPWLDWVWDVYSAQDVGGQYEKPGSVTGHFTLSKSSDAHSGMPCYVVSPDQLVMPDCWKDDRIQFYPVGSKPPKGVLTKPLEPWSSTSEPKWMDAASALRRLLQSDPDVQHLVSVIYPEGPPEIIYLIRLDNAVKDGSPLFAMRLQSHIAGLRILEDGTAHGGGH